MSDREAAERRLDQIEADHRQANSKPTPTTAEMISEACRPLENLINSIGSKPPRERAQAALAECKVWIASYFNT